MDRLLKKERRSLRPGGEESPSLIRAVLFGIGAFILSAFLLSVAATAFAYGQKDPDAYLFLGTACPFLGAVLSGAVSGKMYRDRPWMSGGITGTASSLLLWLLSAGLAGETAPGQAILMHLAVAAVATLSALLFGTHREKRRRRRPSRHKC